MKRKFEIQQDMEVFLEPTGDYARKSNRPHKGTIASIGRKYFYVTVPDSPWQNIKFDRKEFACHIDDDPRFIDDDAGFEIYPSIEAFEAEKTRMQMLYEIYDAIEFAIICNRMPGVEATLSDKTIAEIHQILEKEHKVPKWEKGRIYYG